ncbi:MAG: hypothetical protein K5931_09070 [Lachnospiraceae bacterium]|nr:hypothetical protein [Lachnospiraceae bacterium]
MAYSLAVVAKEPKRLFGWIEQFMKRRITTFWCEFKVDDIIAVKDGVEGILLILPEEEDFSFSQISIFLRDMCLDEEKPLYIMGSEEMTKRVKKYIPNMLITGLYMKENITIPNMIADISSTVSGSDKQLKGLLLVDDDTDYFKSLGSMVKSDFHVVVTRPHLKDLLKYLLKSDIVIININMNMPIIEQAIMFDAIRKKQRKSSVKLMFIANRREDQENINLIIADSVLCFSKETEVNKVAYYIKTHYGDQNR